uniref:Uncharacterized protein n=1 Tax=viral metagenome TaxID=1070528 RepID=A0A6C0EAI1_9ZZZZ
MDYYFIKNNDYDGFPQLLIVEHVHDKYHVKMYDPRMLCKSFYLSVDMIDDFLEKYSIFNLKEYSKEELIDIFEFGIKKYQEEQLYLVVAYMTEYENLYKTTTDEISRQKYKIMYDIYEKEYDMCSSTTEQIIEERIKFLNELQHK